MTDVLFIGSEKAFPPELEETIRGQGHATMRHLGAADVLTGLGNGAGPLIFLDAEAPQYDALALLKKILSRQPAARIVLTSKRPSVNLAVEAIREGAWDILPRPLEAGRVGLLAGQMRAGAEEAAAPEGGGSAGGEIITRDEGFLRVLAIAEKAAAGVSSVLIQGESGTGKEMLARFIHQRSPRRDKPFVAVNCAALPETLLESELFGHEKGAFTGAAARRLGKFELASGGTLLLDEITEMDLHLQAKLLRVLQEQTIDRLGGQTPVRVDVRVVATTNRELRAYMEEGKFREDLYYRLNVIPLAIPPLRDRAGDVPLLVEHFVKKHKERNHVELEGISKKVFEVLGRLSWKGNVRELENAIERAVVLSSGGELLVEHLLLDEAGPGGDGPRAAAGRVPDAMVGQTVHEMERRLILSTLKKVSENRTRAAEMLGISIRTLRNKLKEYESREEGKE